MDEEFVPYEISLELKELGFSERCLKSYYKGSILLEGHGNVYDTPAPTFSQCFRWFREKYNLIDYPEFDYDEQKWFCHSDYHIFKIYFKTYEKAEIDCLIKLIKIVKSKSE